MTSCLAVCTTSAVLSLSGLLLLLGPAAPREEVLPSGTTLLVVFFGLVRWASMGLVCRMDWDRGCQSSINAFGEIASQ